MTKKADVIGSDPVHPDLPAESKLTPSLAEELARYYGAIPSIILVLDPLTQSILYANQSACEYYGCGPDQLTGKPVKELEHTGRKLQAAIFSGQPGNHNRAVLLQHKISGSKIRDVEITACLLNLNTRSLLTLTVQDKTRTLSDEKRFHENEAKYQVILNQIPGSVVSFRPVLNETGEVTDGIIEEYNANLLLSLGLQHKEIHGKNLLSIFGDANQITILNLCQQAKELYRSKQENIKFKGQSAGMFLRAFRINPVLFILIGTEVQKQNNISSVLPVSADSLPSMIDTFPGFVILLQKDGGIGYCNQAVSKYLGINSDTLNGTGLLNTIHPEDLVELRQAWKRKSSDIEVFEIEARVRGADWNYRWFMCRITPVMDETENVHSWACLLVDITDRKQSEAALRISEENTRLIYRTSMDGIIICSAAGTILDANTSASSLFGRTEDELKGMVVQDILDIPNSNNKHTKHRRLGKNIYSGELTGIRKDGSRFPIEAGSSTFLDVNGASRFSIFIRDITLRKQVEHSLTEQLHELTCLSETGQFLEIQDIQPEDLFEKVFESFSHTFPQPENISVQLEYNNQNITLVNSIKEGKGQISRDLTMDGVKTGSITVFYPDTELLRSQNKIILLGNLGQMLELWLQRRNTELEVRKLGMAIEQSPLAVMITDEKGIVTYINHGFTLLTGFEEKELLGNLPFSMDSNILDPALRQNLLETLASKTPWQAEINYSRKNGTPFWVSINVVPIKDEAGSLISYVSMMEDITDRKNDQQIIHDALGFNQRILQVSPIGMIIYDASGQCIQANEAAARITGISLESILQQNYHNLQSWKTGGMYDAALKAFHGSDPVQIQGNYVSSFGRTLWLNISFVQFTTNELPHLLMVFEDNTLQKSAEASIKITNEKLSALVNSLEKNKMESDLLQQLVEMLQRCQDVHEAFSIIHKFGGLIFPGSSGALYTLEQAENHLHLSQSWGEDPNTSHNIYPDVCLTMKTKKTFLYSSLEGGPSCSHIPADFFGSYIEIPMQSEGMITEVLHIEWAANDRAAIENQGPAYILAENIMLSLANIRLRSLLQQQSIRDPLTGAFNRRFMAETLQKEFPRAMRRMQKVGLIMIDIDHFKFFNDQYGHAAGDHILLHLVGLLNNLVRSEDIVCRMGGEEFIVIMPDVSLEVTRERAELIRSGMATESINFAGNILGQITLSIGAALFPDHGNDAELILRRVDTALYAAKNNGRNRVEVVSLSV